MHATKFWKPLLALLFVFAGATNAYAQGTDPKPVSDSLYVRISFSSGNSLVFPKAGNENQGFLKIDSLAYTFRKEGDQIQVTVHSAGKEILSIDGISTRASKDTTRVYDVNKIDAGMLYSKLYTVFDCRVKSIRVLDYESVIRNPALQNRMQKLFSTALTSYQ